ncbi:unnamed protein product [Schistosoma curassoni]|uniref:Endo/exonuclease/phosphatase domain-containing protein n=1 Tax=Schistosoma curassoni TaxID=6186 RepID=A0A183KK34_9TREM|nr:unnamed protein product [Schistosoma curassoni]
MPQNISRVTLLKVYRLSSQANLKPNQSRLLKVVFKSSGERDLILHNGHRLKGSGAFVPKDLQLAGRAKRREAVKELQLRLDAGEKGPKNCKFSGCEASTDNDAEATLDETQSGRCLILGDFDAPMVDWENLRTKSPENSFEQELVDVVITCALVQHVEEATRYHADSEPFLLDLILTHYKDDIANLHYMPPLGKSGHAVLAFGFHITVNHEHASAHSRPNV